jgi:hypothetical protein
VWSVAASFLFLNEATTTGEKADALRAPTGAKNFGETKGTGPGNTHASPLATTMKSPIVLAACLVACSTAAGTVVDELDTSPEGTATTVAANDAGVDGTPTRVPCTSNFGDGLSGTFGRLDGVVVAVVPPGHGTCNADAHHVHVQVLSRGQTYDVAVNTDSGFIAEKDVSLVSLPSGPWADGWHGGGSLDYVADLGLHDADFTAGSEADLDQRLETALASANHVSLFATLYSHGGVHLVHRRGHGQDGALVTDPLSPSSHLFAFHFSNQSF